MYPTVLDGIKCIYTDKIQPIEAMYKFEDFHFLRIPISMPNLWSCLWHSTGKTSFIRYLLEVDYLSEYWP
ncbi:hypothetical protein Pelo_2962 [Pelomyxa schiedti]|nr:hypothetical protein Pelo_2962 [Pelomyxa schiedti]